MEHLAYDRVFGFLNISFFLFAFNKNQRWFLTHRLKTASAVTEAGTIAVARAGTALK